MMLVVERRLGLLLGFVLSCVVLARGQQLTASQFIEDLIFLEHALLEAHPGVGRYESADSLRAFFYTLRARIRTDSVSKRQAHWMVRMAVARVRDGHTSVLTPVLTRKDDRFFPADVWAVESGLVVMRYYGGDSALVRGDILALIDEVSVSTALAVFRLITPGDGFSPTFRDAVACNGFSRYWKMLFDVDDTLRVVRRDRLAPHRPQRVAVASIKASDLENARKEALRERIAQVQGLVPVWQNRSQALYRDTLFPDLAIMRMTGFPSRGYRPFYRKSFRWMRKQGINVLALDLRYNTGGNVSNMNYLLSCLMDTTFYCRYERDSRARYRPWFRGKQRLVCGLVALRYDGSPWAFKRYREGLLKVSERRVRPRMQHKRRPLQVFVLTNGWTFSAASMTASYLKYSGKAQVIGLETGGGAAGNCGGGYPKLRLPHTKIQIRFPMLWLNYGLPEAPMGRGVRPDYPTSYELDDLLQRRDVEIQTLYQLMERSKSRS